MLLKYLLRLWRWEVDIALISSKYTYSCDWQTSRSSNRIHNMFYYNMCKQRL